MQDKLTEAEQVAIKSGLQLVPSQKHFSRLSMSSKRGRKKKSSFDADFDSMDKLEREALLESAQLSSINPSHLLRAIHVPDGDRVKAGKALIRKSMGVASLPAFLPADKCARVREHIGRTVKGDTIDSVDHCPEFQVSLSREQLSSLLEPHVVAALWALPTVFLEEQASAAALAEAVSRLTERELEERGWKGRVGIFGRKYEDGGRTHLGFHIDTNRVTINISLSPQSSHLGGNLLFLSGQALQLVRRDEGELSIHRGDVAHAVTKMQEGVRYSVILFFH
ncbi:hypothetical protein GUITHDRAFT_117613 [Guillardia theta CCMP2712]|uniref:Fe2OG dioxygenase domain-containing protein n=1 Tax=Guillardia theta (strain CCMP2712) TaxID=905079 RepID=L1IJ20_GUITC|nr:hypothetical protein GUITHDRAFT_117613 [Guillardia theta CCMP2712]EKX36258.1 hypothetical protein GUITHDRAFT_117613 [Guillardia theta CCMP2712]|eukprot:XP_005823238.1 hypothetical protein GUITHDRAFT_117613 [Guillardia theta CCMP2712]